MNLKDILIGSFATLFVTVAGGVGVYYLTKEPQKNAPTENLVFTFEKPQKFYGEERKLSFANLRVANIGDAPAQNVTIALKRDIKLGVVDKNISLSSGPAGKFKISVPDPTEFQVNIPSLTPNEVATISLLLEGDQGLDFDIGVKSDRTIGANGSIIRTVAEEPNKREQLRDIAVVAVPLAAILQIVLFFYIWPRIRSFIRKTIPTSQSLNNTAWLYLHKGLSAEARKMLEMEIQRSGADPYMLANYGLSLALEGEAELAKKQFDAADFFGEESHERAVVLFSKAISELHNGNKDVGLSHMNEAHELSKTEIERYARYSDLIRELSIEFPEIKNILSMNSEGVVS